MSCSVVSPIRSFRVIFRSSLVMIDHCQSRLIIVGHVQSLGISYSVVASDNE